MNGGFERIFLVIKPKMCYKIMGTVGWLLTQVFSDPICCTNFVLISLI